jgi:tetratricopeptide (TPR) repeat protein
MKHCPNCGSDFPDKYRFCQHDRTVLIEVPDESSTSLAVAEPPKSKSREPTSSGDSKLRRKRATIFAGVGGVVLIIVLVVVYFMFFAFSAKKTVLAEVRKSNLVKPQGNSAYDLYLKYQDDGLTQSDVQEIATEVVPQLEKRGDEIISNVKRDQIESEGDWTEAIRLYGWLNELRPGTSYQAREQLSTGRLALLKKDYDGALSSLQRSLERDSSSALTLNTIGRIFLAKKDRTSAQEYYKRATIAEPGWIWPWINLGAISNDLQDYSTAESALRQAIQLNYQKASPHNLLGQTLESTNRLCEALSEYQLALSSATNNPTPTVNVDSLRRKVDSLNSQGLACQN